MEIQNAFLKGPIEVCHSDIQSVVQPQDIPKAYPLTDACLQWLRKNPAVLFRLLDAAHKAGNNFEIPNLTSVVLEILENSPEDRSGRAVNLSKDVIRDEILGRREQRLKTLPLYFGSVK